MSLPPDVHRRTVAVQARLLICLHPYHDLSSECMQLIQDQMYQYHRGMFQQILRQPQSKALTYLRHRTPLLDELEVELPHCVSPADAPDPVLQWDRVLLVMETAHRSLPCPTNPLQWNDLLCCFRELAHRLRNAQTWWCAPANMVKSPSLLVTQALDNLIQDDPEASVCGVASGPEREETLPQSAPSVAVHPHSRHTAKRRRIHRRLLDFGRPAPRHTLTPTQQLERHFHPLLGAWLGPLPPRAPVRTRTSTLKSCGASQSSPVKYCLSWTTLIKLNLVAAAATPGSASPSPPPPRPCATKSARVISSLRVSEIHWLVRKVRVRALTPECVNVLNGGSGTTTSECNPTRSTTPSTSTHAHPTKH